MSFITPLVKQIPKHVYKILFLTLGSDFRDVFGDSGKEEWMGGNLS